MAKIRNPLPLSIKWSGPDRREYFLDHLIKTNGWTIGIEVGVRVGRTLFHLLDNNPDLKMYAVDKDISRLYTKAMDSLPQDAVITPQHTVEAINAVKAKVKTAILSPSEKELLATLDTLGNNLMFNNSLAVPMPVEM